MIQRFVLPITGGPSLLDLDKKDWKPWRAIFNKGFRGDLMYSLVPHIVEEVQVFANTLRGLADKNEMAFLDPITLRFKIDLIAKTVLNAKLNAQTGYNILADTFLDQTRWNDSNADINPFSRLNFVRKFMHWWNGRILDRYIGMELDKRYEEYKSNPDNPNSKSVMDLVIQEYLKASTENLPSKFDAHFRTFAIRQMRLFIFAGYDTTASVICYCFHALSKHPDVSKPPNPTVCQGKRKSTAKQTPRYSPASAPNTTKSSAPTPHPQASSSLKTHPSSTTSPTPSPSSKKSSVSIHLQAACVPANPGSPSPTTPAPNSQPTPPPSGSSTSKCKPHQNTGSVLTNSYRSGGWYLQAMNCIRSRGYGVRLR